MTLLLSSLYTTKLNCLLTIVFNHGVNTLKREPRCSNARPPLQETGVGELVELHSC